MKNLIKKYEKSGPRYTSYPPYPFWEGAPSQEDWFSSLRKSKALEGVDLYIHVPFCEKLCFYCGCNRTVTKNHDVESPYVSALKKELLVYKKELGSVKINSIHLGGGTPTFLSKDSLNDLLGFISSNFILADNFVGAMEIDPRVTTMEHIDVLAEFNFTRISLGIQDFNPEVQKAVNRIQSYEQIEKLVSYSRSKGIKSVNFDLIYGLPLQTVESISETVDKVENLLPDTIAFYSYAHVPWKIKSQKGLEKYNLPLGEEKQKLKDIGVEKLCNLGYFELGMDHFVLKTDPLYHAYHNGKLHRNFMGYTIQNSMHLIGIGASSISSSGDRFIQNEKDAFEYMKLMQGDRLPIMAGHSLSLADQALSKVIQEVMCLDQSILTDLFDTVSPPTKRLMDNHLDDLMEDGLISLNQDLLIVDERGKPFLRNICMALDYRLLERPQAKEGSRFSKTI